MSFETDLNSVLGPKEDLAISYEFLQQRQYVKTLDELKAIATVKDDKVTFKTNKAWVEIFKDIQFDIKFQNVHNMSVNYNCTNKSLKLIPDNVKNRITIRGHAINDLSNVDSKAVDLTIEKTSITSLDGLKGTYNILNVNDNIEIKELGADKNLTVINFSVMSPNSYSARFSFNVKEEVGMSSTKFINNILFLKTIPESIVVNTLYMNHENLLDVFAETDDIYDFAVILLERGYNEDVVSV